MNEELTNGQRRAIETLMLTNTMAEAAKMAKVTQRSIYNWMKQDRFQTVLRQARRDALAQTTTRLQQMTAQAVHTLGDVMEDENASHAGRVSAARLTLDMMYHGAALDDIVERLKTVEKTQLDELRR